MAAGPKAPPLRPRTWDVESEIDEEVEEARNRLWSLRGVEARAEYADDAVEALRNHAASVDLLVLGSHITRPTDRFVHGGKSQWLADDAPSPLLVLPSASRQ